MGDGAVSIRPAVAGDRLPLARLLAEVAEEGTIGSEPPVDIARRAANWKLDGTLVAVVADVVVGELRVESSYFGFGEIGMMVASGWRSEGIGSALVAAAIDFAQEQGLHKLSLSVFPHNKPARGLYEKFGFVEEGWRAKHVRRRDGELWDVIDMGLLL
jgi:RimJ/RimL family protein N-acetyltransferase